MALIESPYLLGGSAVLVRALDVSEDWDVNFIDPSVNTANFWFNWYGNQYVSASSWGNPDVSRAGYPLVLTGGPHAGINPVGHAQVLALGDDKIVLADDDGSLSLYNYAGGTVSSNPTQTVFSGGAWNGATLSSKLKYLVGFEESSLYFVEGASTLHVYSTALAWKRTQTVALGHELAAYTLGDLVDNKIPGYTYIGWDVGPIVVGVSALRPLDHLELTAAGAEGLVGEPITVTIKACAVGDCSTLYTRGVSGALALSDGTVVPFTLPLGASQVAVDVTVASLPPGGEVEVGVSGLSASALGTPAHWCGFGEPAASTASCHLALSLPLHHLAVSSAASAGVTCAPTQFTVQACANADCSLAYTRGWSGKLVFSGAGAVVHPASSISVSLPPGASSVVLDAQVTVVPVSGHVGVAVVESAPAASASPATHCGFGVAPSALASCEFPVYTAGLLLGVPNHRSEASVNLTILAVKQGADTASCSPAFVSASKTVRMACDYVNPGAGLLPVRVGGMPLNAAGDAAATCDGTGRDITLHFDAEGVATVALQYADAGAVSVSASYTGSGADAGLSMGGATSFIATPDRFSVARADANPMVAGQDFAMRIVALNVLGEVTRNFGRELPVVADLVRLGWTKYRPTGLASVSGDFTGEGTTATTPLSSDRFSLGEVMVSTLRWSEVGTGDVSATLVGGAYLGSGGAVSGSTGMAGAVGPVLPHHFDVRVEPGCGSFTYSGQPFAVGLSAMNAAGQITKNYDGGAQSAPNFARTVSLTVTTGGALGALSPAQVQASSFSQGEARTAHAFTFTQPLTPPTSVTVRATDTDGVSSAAGGLEPAAVVRSGRLKISNRYGAASQALDVPVQAQLWSGQAWVLNHEDACTIVPSGAVALSQHLNAVGQPMAAWPAGLSSVSLSGGQGVLRLPPPPGGLTGSVDLAIKLGTGVVDRSCLASHPATVGAAQPWLRGRYGDHNGCAVSTSADHAPSARATFGVHAPEARN